MELCSIQSDAGRPCFHHRHRRDNHRPPGTYPALISPTRSPYPLPYYHSCSKTPFLERGDDQPLNTSTDDPLVASESSPSLRHLRHSVPDVIYKHGPRVPSSSPYSSSPVHTGAIHGARARFVSLPAVISSLPGIDTECDRLERACGRAPPTAVFLRSRGGSGDNDLPPSSPHQPRRGDNGGPPPPLAPKWSHWELVLRIKRVLRNDGKDIRDYVEAGQIDQLYHRDIEERARREQERARTARMRTGQELSDSGDNTHIFGVPLNESVLRAPATAILGGYRHDLPLVVFLCVEELYRTGIYKSGLFRDLPNRQRHHELNTLFDTPPAFGEGMSLRAESTADICALLLTYLKELPEPVLTPYLFNAFWNWSVRPSVKREDERMRKEQDEEEDLRTCFFQTGQRPPRPSRRVLYEKARLRAAQDETAETGQVAVARDLLRLLPTHSFSLIVYLCAFFTQVPLCPENGITFEDIGRIFGPPVFGGPVPAARRMMVWFLKRWNRVSDGLLDADPNSDDSEDADGATTGSSPPLLLRRDMRNLERVDSFKLLAPEEQEEDELVGFRASLIDSAGPHEGHDYRYQPNSLRRERGSAGVMTPLLSQNQHSSATQEMARASRRKGSTGPDDPMVMQVPPRDQGHSSPECIEGEAFSPQHSLAPMSRRESRIRRSPERRFSEDESPNDPTAHMAAGEEDTLKRWQLITAAITNDAQAHHHKDRDGDREDDHDQLLMALSRLHEARARIDELEHAVADAATQSERAREKLSYVATATPTITGRRIVNRREVLDSYARFEQELKHSALEKDDSEANQLVKNVCAVLKSVVQQQAAARTAEAR